MYGRCGAALGFLCSRSRSRLSGIVWGLLLWGLGIFWLFIAVVSMSTVFAANGFGSFSLGLWASTFPLGSLALLTLALGDTFDALFFKCGPALHGRSWPAQPSSESLGL